MDSQQGYTAFDGGDKIAHGSLSEVVLAVKKRLGRAEHGLALIFSDDTGKTMDFNFQGGEKDVRKRLEVFAQGEALPSGEATGPGRPRLGVVSREVSLLPRQWEWLAAQSGGASGVLRRLVDEARKKTHEGGSVKQLQERVYKFLSVIAGDLPGYEEALRALYKKDQKAFRERMAGWPPDVKAHAARLAGPVFPATGG